MTKLATIFEQGLRALEDDDLTSLRRVLDDARRAGAEDDDPRMGYFEFLDKWLDDSTPDEEIDELVAGLDQVIGGALELDGSEFASRIVLDLADILVEIGEGDEADEALSSLLEREDLDIQPAAEALMIRAHIAMEFHENVEEALELLDEVDHSLRERIGYVSLRAAVLVELEREEEALELLRKAVARDDDTELHYQLGVLLRLTGDEDGATEHLLLVRRRDIAEHGVTPGAAVPRDEGEDLRRQLEDILDSLPEPVMARLASAAIRVERWIDEAAIRQGADPRTGLAFEGRPSEHEDDEGEVEAIVVFRDAIVTQIDNDEEIPSMLALCLVEEVDRFFDLELFPG